MKKRRTHPYSCKMPLEPWDPASMARSQAIASCTIRLPPNVRSRPDGNRRPAHRGQFRLACFRTTTCGIRKFPSHPKRYMCCNAIIQSQELPETAANVIAVTTMAAAAKWPSYSAQRIGAFGRSERGRAPANCSTSPRRPLSCARRTEASRPRCALRQPREER
jgi:hypothetical protein